MNVSLARGGWWQPGLCWFCRRENLLVTWLGPAEYGPWHAPMFACEPCRAWLAHRVLAHRAALPP